YLGDELIAMALFLKTEKTLYGRYWGIKPEYEEDYRYLHFELCYYQGMEMCFENSLELFEAGAQGEQKLLRGFTPVEILSSHRLKHPELEKIIRDHTKQQNELVAQKIDELQQYLPFKAQ
ncbi:peptidogalycan biosysnthesis protein, partial [Bacteriovoracaceae bacterium]|nr:peptidogalycan biosysnthesis protein [Bacteriovoracaceae bacterium]